METQTLAQSQPATIARRTVDDIVADVNLIQRILREIMKDGTHYGVIPGTDKPSLWKPGAEQILSAFRIAVDPEVEDLSMLGRDGVLKVHYRVKVRGSDMISGRFLGAGIGECSSDEEKYRWKAAASPAEWEATDPHRRRLKYRGDAEIMQVKAPAEDVANTILKMAKKRALIDFTLTATAASDVFTQDLREDDEPPIDGAPRQSKPKTSAPTTSNGGNVVEGLITDRKQAAKGTNARGEWIKYAITVDGKAYTYFADSKFAPVIDEARAANDRVRVTFKRGQYGLEIEGLANIGQPAEREAGEEG